MGSSSALPPVAGFGRPGSFVLRSAADAMLIRAYAQEHGCRDAVVAGGGLLGLEAAHSLHELGLRVTVLERGGRLLSRQIDEYCSELVDAHFARIGMQVLYRAESESLTGEDRVRGVTLKDGRTLRCDMFLAAVGIRPNVELARAGGHRGQPRRRRQRPDGDIRSRGVRGGRRGRARRAGPRAVADRGQAGRGRGGERARRRRSRSPRRSRRRSSRASASTCSPSAGSRRSRAMRSSSTRIRIRRLRPTGGWWSRRDGRWAPSCWATIPRPSPRPRRRSRTARRSLRCRSPTCGAVTGAR